MGRHLLRARRHQDVFALKRTPNWPAVFATLLITASLGVIRSISAAPALACDITTDPNCVGVGAGGGGGPGSGGGTQPPGRGGGGGGSAKPNACAKYPAGYYEDCKTSKGGQCLSLYDQYFRTMPLDQFNSFATANQCPAVVAAANPPPTPAELAQQAAATFRLPNPSGHRSPSENQKIGSYPFTYVHLYTFFWTDPGTWESATARASAGGNYATVTATPVSLTFDPGNASGDVSCAGPGRPWVESDGNGPPSGGACAHQYSHVTGPGYDQSGDVDADHRVATDLDRLG